jgi:hypothetical protein
MAVFLSSAKGISFFSSKYCTSNADASIKGLLFFYFGMQVINLQYTIDF